jgi:hypothetical protein
VYFQKYGFTHYAVTNGIDIAAFVETNPIGPVAVYEHALCYVSFVFYFALPSFCTYPQITNYTEFACVSCLVVCHYTLSHLPDH